MERVGGSEGASERGREGGNGVIIGKFAPDKWPVTFRVYLIWCVLHAVVKSLLATSKCK